MWGEFPSTYGGVGVWVFFFGLQWKLWKHKVTLAHPEVTLLQLLIIKCQRVEGSNYGKSIFVTSRQHQAGAQLPVSPGSPACPEGFQKDLPFPWT